MLQEFLKLCGSGLFSNICSLCLLILNCPRNNCENRWSFYIWNSYLKIALTTKTKIVDYFMHTIICSKSFCIFCIHFTMDGWYWRHLILFSGKSSMFLFFMRLKRIFNKFNIQLMAFPTKKLITAVNKQQDPITTSFLSGIY